MEMQKKLHVQLWIVTLSRWWESFYILHNNNTIRHKMNINRHAIDSSMGREGIENIFMTRMTADMESSRFLLDFHIYSIDMKISNNTKIVAVWFFMSITYAWRPSAVNTPATKCRKIEIKIRATQKIWKKLNRSQCMKYYLIILMSKKEENW